MISFIEGRYMISFEKARLEEFPGASNAEA